MADHSPATAKVLQHALWQVNCTLIFHQRWLLSLCAPDS